MALQRQLRQGTIVTDAPVGNPVTLAVARAQVQLEPGDTSQDTWLTRLCSAAYRHVEKFLDYPILVQTRQTHLRGFPCDPIVLGGGFGLTVDQIQYYDSNGTLQTMDNADYIVDAVSVPSQLVPAVNGSWPSTQLRPSAVQITWTAGWADETEVDNDIIQAMCLLIGHWDQNREAVVVGAVSNEVQMSVAMLLQPHRLMVI